MQTRVLSWAFLALFSTQKSVMAMPTRQKGEWGLGFQIGPSAEAPRFLHGGSVEGFRAELVCGFDGTIVMANSDNASALAREVIQSIANGRLPNNSSLSRPICRISGSYGTTRVRRSW